MARAMPTQKRWLTLQDQDSNPDRNTTVAGQTIYVTHSSAHGHREISFPAPTTYPMGFEKPLKEPRVTGKGDSSASPLAPTFEMVVRARECTVRKTTYSITPCRSSLMHRARVGSTSKQSDSQGCQSQKADYV